jgi:mRNA interferase RelE/StbE
MDCIESLQLNPRPTGIKKLVNKINLYRIRVDDHRIIYKIEDSVLLVLIVKVGNRKDIYRRLNEIK